MNGFRKIGKRLLSVTLAAAMSVTAMGTQAFASNEGEQTDAAAVTGRVISWSWPEGTTLAWSEEAQSWALSCVYSEAQPLTEETLDQLLPDQISAFSRRLPPPKRHWRSQSLTRILRPP